MADARADMSFAGSKRSAPADEHEAWKRRSRASRIIRIADSSPGPSHSKSGSKSSVIVITDKDTESKSSVSDGEGSEVASSQIAHKSEQSPKPAIRNSRTEIAIGRSGTREPGRVSWTWDDTGAQPRWDDTPLRHLPHPFSPPRIPKPGMSASSSMSGGSSARPSEEAEPSPGGSHQGSVELSSSTLSSDGNQELSPLAGSLGSLASQTQNVFAIAGHQFRWCPNCKWHPGVPVSR